MKHNLTPRQWLPWFIFLLVGVCYEIYCVFWGVANDTLSHVVVWTIQDAPWVGVALPVMVVLVLGHWLLKKWIWQPPKFVDEDASEDADKESK